MAGRKPPRLPGIGPALAGPAGPAPKPVPPAGAAVDAPPPGLEVAAGTSSNKRYGPVDPKTGKRTVQPCPRCLMKRCECLEREAMRQFAAAGFPEPFRQVAFARRYGRQWKADLVYRDAGVIVEIEGAGGGGGRHASAVGYRDDCEKYNAAAALGWRVLRLTGYHLRRRRGETESYAVRAVRAALEPGTGIAASPPQHVVRKRGATKP